MLLVVVVVVVSTAGALTEIQFIFVYLLIENLGFQFAIRYNELHLHLAVVKLFSSLSCFFESIPMKKNGKIEEDFFNSFEL